MELGGETEDFDGSQPGAAVKDEAYYLREAQAALEQGQFEPALRLYSKVLEFNPQNTRAWTAQVRMLIELGEYREATLWADKAMERFPDDPELLAAKAVALGRSGDVDAALAFSDASMEQRGDNPYVWLARGDVLLARRETRADYCIDKALMLAPQNWLVTWLAARVRYYYKQFILALGLLRKATEISPARDFLWLDMGRCQRHLGMVGAAEVSLQRALDLNPQCGAASDELMALSKTGFAARLRDQVRQLFHR